MMSKAKPIVSRLVLSRETDAVHAYKEANGSSRAFAKIIAQNEDMAYNK